jgi:hypothetical protein
MFHAGCLNDFVSSELSLIFQSSRRILSITILLLQAEVTVAGI